MNQSTEKSYYQCGTKSFAVVGHGSELYHSDNGEDFYPLNVGGGSFGYSHGKPDSKISFSDPRNDDSEGMLILKDGLITVGTMTFRPVPAPVNARFHPLPTVRRPEYLFRTEGGKYIYVSSDKYQYSYESFKLFYGTADAMKLVPVIDVVRYRDGGTTYVKTALGTLFSPTPFNKLAKPTWLDKKIKRLDAENFTITETDELVTLTS